MEKLDAGLRGVLGKTIETFNRVEGKTLLPRGLTGRSDEYNAVYRCNWILGHATHVILRLQ